MEALGEGVFLMSEVLILEGGGVSYERGTNPRWVGISYERGTNP